MSAQTRKQRKQNRRKKGQKNKRLSNKQIDKLAWAIVLADPPLVVKHANEYCYCSRCNQSYCIGFDGFSYFCRECIYIKFNPDACLKRVDAPLKQFCSHCGERSIRR